MGSQSKAMTRAGSRCVKSQKVRIERAEAVLRKAAKR
jgi:hypothetical protein